MMRVSWEEFKRALAGAAYLTALMILVTLAVHTLGPLESVVAFLAFFASGIALARLAGLEAVGGGGAAVGILAGIASLILLSTCLTALAGLAPLVASLAAGLLGAGVAVGASWLAHRLKRGGAALSSWMAEASPWLED